LNADAADFLEEIELIKQLLKIKKVDLPWPLLRFQHALERFSGTAMAASRVEEDDCEFAVHKPAFRLLAVFAVEANYRLLNLRRMVLTT
jgi:hypothetical protein